MIKEKTGVKANEKNEEKKYIPFYYDVLFYKIYGDDKDTSLLKRLIELSLNIKVKDVRILNGKMLSDRYKNKVSYLDLYVELDDGSKVSIEVNTNTSDFIKDRNLYFLAKTMANDMESGETYFDFKCHYQINLNASKTKRQKYPFNENFFMNIHLDEYSTKAKIIEIDLLYFKNLCYTNGDLKSFSEFEKLMGLLGCETSEEQKFFESEKGMFENIMKKADKFRDDSKMIEMYDRDTMFEQIKLKELNEALEKNTQEVTDKITEEVTNKVTEEVTNKVTKEVTSSTTRNIAIKLLSSGIDLETIASATGLSIDELNNL